MMIYCYDRSTKEYLYSSIAEADPEETKIQGRFIPLLPAYSTLTAPPEYGENQIPVFENGNWIIKADYRKKYKMVNNDFIVSDITTIGELSAGYPVTNEIAQEIIENPMRFKIAEGEVVKKTDEEYEEELNQKEKVRVANLHMTKLDFYKFILKPNGIEYSDLIKILESNQDLKAAWDLCKDVYRGDETLNNYINNYINITDEELDMLFEQYGD